MLKQDFLQFLHDDWKQNLTQLNADLKNPGASRNSTLERIRKADQWIAYYANQLRAHYGVEA